MIDIENLVLWDRELTPTRIPKISIDPEAYSRLAAEDKWIICGKWKVRVNVQPTDNGITFISTSGGTVTTAGSAGSLFLDEEFLDVQPADGNQASVVGGRIAGTFDISW